MDPQPSASAGVWTSQHTFLLSGEYDLTIEFTVPGSHRHSVTKALTVMQWPQEELARLFPEAKRFSVCVKDSRGEAHPPDQTTTCFLASRPLPPLGGYQPLGMAWLGEAEQASGKRVTVGVAVDMKGVVQRVSLFEDHREAAGLGNTQLLQELVGLRVDDVSRQQQLMKEIAESVPATSGAGVVTGTVGAGLSILRW